MDNNLLYKVEKSYGLIKFATIFLILSGFISMASASGFSQLQWGEGVSGKLQRGEVISYMGYSVEVIGFPPPVESDKYKIVPEEPVEPSVGLNISKNGSFIDTTVLGLGDSYIAIDGGLKVTAKELPSKNAKEWLFESYAPWATIELNPRGTPRLEVSIDTDRDKYVSSSATDIIATVKLKNTGSADAVNVDMVIETELPVKRESLKYHYERVKKEETIAETITFASPMLREEKTYGISANVSGYDVMDISYATKFQKSFSIAVEPEAGLSIRKSAINKMYLKDYTIISLSIKNNGKYDLKNVSVTDSLPTDFKLLGNNSLHWITDIPANGDWDSHYLVKPLEPNKDGTVFPAATAEFTIKKEKYSIRSNQPRIIVYGPKIILSKQTDVSEVNPGDTVIVTVVAENTGSTPTKVVIKDKLPKDATLVSGSTTREEFLEANKKVSFNYTLKIDSIEPLKLPRAAANYYELGTKGGNVSTVSQELEIRIKPEIPANTPSPQIITPTPTPVPAVTVQQAIEPQHNSTNSSAVKKSELLREVDIFFYKSILGCNDISNNNSRFNATRNACNFFKQGFDTQ